jgi:hypothetical protein
MAQAKGITLPIVYKSDPKGLNKAKGQLSGFASSLSGLPVRWLPRSLLPRL